MYDRVLEKCLWGHGKVLEIFLTKRVGTLCNRLAKRLFLFLRYVSLDITNLLLQVFKTEILTSVLNKAISLYLLLFATNDFSSIVLLLVIMSLANPLF